MTLAAEAPDLDVLWSVRGPVANFEHHRGITHTLIGSPFIALATVGVVWCVSYVSGRIVPPSPRTKSTQTRAQQPVRWLWLLLLAWIATLSHLLLDYTNNYGLRPFFPFNPRWYSGDFVFIFEPVLFAALLLALLMPWLFGLADSEIGARRAPFRGTYWARFALLVMIGIWSVRWIEHRRAVQLVGSNLSLHDASPLRVTVDPYPIDPFRWHAVADFGDAYQLAGVNTLHDSVVPDEENSILYKQPQTPAMLAAEKSWLGRVYLDWSSYPVVEQLAPVADSTSPVYRPLTGIRFRDLRFAYAILGHGGNGPNSPLSANVLVGPDGQIVEMRIGDRVQH